MKTLGVRVSRRSCPKSNKGREPSTGRSTWRRQAPRNLAAPLSGRSIPNLCAVDWNFAAFFRRSPRPTALSQTRGFPLDSIILSGCKNIWDLRPPVSVEVRMREIQRTRQQPIPTYSGPYSTAAAAPTWPPLGFDSRFFGSRFSHF
jgi:hypothetical protein